MLSYDYEEPGEWLAATDEGRLLVVRAGDSGAAIDRLWTGFGLDDGVQGVLDELTSQGLFQTPPFALLTWTGAMAEGPVSVRTIVRGDVSVRLTTANGPIDVSGRGVSTWSEQSFADVSAIFVDGGGPGAAAGGPSLPLAAGMARTRRIRTATPPGRAGASAASLPVVARAAEPTISEARAAERAAAEQATAEQRVAEQTVVEPAVAEQTVVEPAAAEREPEHEPEHEPARGSAPRDSEDPTAGYDHLFGVTMMRGVEQAAVRPADAEEDDAEGQSAAGPTAAAAQIELPPFMTGSDASAAIPAPDPAAPESADRGDHDGLTVMSGDIRKLRGPGRRPPQATEAPAPASSLYLLLPNGETEALGQPVLVGRSPSVRKVSGGQVPRLVSLGGIDHDISRNHVYFAVEGDTVVVTDLHSRNGTLIVLPGKPPQKLRQGEPTSVIVGTIVDLGGDITIAVCEH